MEIITEEEFKDYVGVQMSGATNMMDINAVISLSNGLTKDKCLLIMKNYEELMKKYPNVN